MNSNRYTPQLARIKKVKNEAEGIKSFTLEFEDENLRESFSHRPGQFIELTVFGVGEAPFSITSSPGDKGRIEISVVNVGEVTAALHLKKEGELVGLRGPYGNGFPFDEVKGRDILFVGGGIGLAPLRPLINQMFADRDRFRKIMILYGARTPGLLCFREDLKTWAAQKDSIVLMTVDAPDDAWPGNVGLVTSLLPRVEVNAEKTTAFVCGPPIMIYFAIQDLVRMGLAEDAVITSMERRMECGLGKCGHCSIGTAEVCTDGPVFSYRQLKELKESV
ncbi:MAG TPA: FAD/NAD(P)-binding protein [Thermodesulfobacteriota bacterium]|nr:FAD/NAD(P)-binding protein [Thermodesulfobacteriota bacterium]